MNDKKWIDVEGYVDISLGDLASFEKYEYFLDAMAEGIGQALLQNIDTEPVAINEDGTIKVKVTGYVEPDTKEEAAALLKKMKEDGFIKGSVGESKGPYVVPARAWSDDNRVEVEFDARDYLLIAKDITIQELDAACWRDGYEADAVAAYAASSQSQVAQLFKHLEAVNRKKKKTEDRVGYSVSVDTDAAAHFLKKQRPLLYESLEVCRLPEDK